MTRSFAGLLLLLLAGGTIAGEASDGWWNALDPRDLNGRSITSTGARWVIVFLDPECPVANGYVPTLNALADEFGARGFTFIGAYCDPHAGLESLRRHRADYATRFAAADDRAQRLARHCGASYTPEAVVLGRDGAVLYRGRIDDRVGRDGATRPRATRHDLRDVLRRIEAGERGPFPSAPGFGCALPARVDPP